TNELTDKANQLRKETGKAPSGPTQPLGPFAPAFTVPVGGTPNLPVKPSEPVPVSFGGAIPTAVGGTPITVNLSLSVDASGRGTITSSDANVTLNLFAN